MDWWLNQAPAHVEEMKEFEYNQGTFKRVNDLFGEWELKDLPAQKWEKFDPTESREEAARRVKDLQKCLELVLGGTYDESQASHSEGKFC